MLLLLLLLLKLLLLLLLLLIHDAVVAAAIDDTVLLDRPEVYRWIIFDNFSAPFSCKKIILNMHTNYTKKFILYKDDI